MSQILQYNGIDQFLSKHQTYGQYWDLVKFIMGYQRWNGRNLTYYPESMGINFLIPQTLQYFGYPTVYIYIYPIPAGVADYEWVISMPQYIVDELNQNSDQDNLVIGHCNTFGLYKCKNGLVKDGVREIAFFLANQEKDGPIYCPQ